MQVELPHALAADAAREIKAREKAYSEKLQHAGEWVICGASWASTPTVVIENKPGAGGKLGVDAVAKAPADGYTMVITSIGMATNRHLYQKLSYDPLKDFAPVSQIAVVPNILVVNPDKVVAKTVAELIALAKASPGKLTYASAGNGTSIHLAGELFASMAGVDIVHVPYRGSGPAVSDLIGGQWDWTTRCGRRQRLGSRVCGRSLRTTTGVTGAPPALKCPGRWTIWSQMRQMSRRPFPGIPSTLSVSRWAAW